MLLVIVAAALLVLLGGGTGRDGVLHGICTMGTPDGTSCADALVLTGYP